MRVVLCYPLQKRHLEQIAEAAPGLELIDAGQERIAEELLTADIFCGHAKVPVNWDAVVRQGRLRWIQSSAAGMDHCLVPSVIASDITVTSASGVLAEQVAEHTIALLTGWCRNLPTFFRAQQRKEFVRQPTRDLSRSTVGIMGFGGVGRRLARLLAAFECRVLATDMFPADKPEYVEALWPAACVDRLLGQVDFLVLAVPLNAMTRGMVAAGLLGKLKRHAVLANMARGPLVVEPDLVRALEEGHLAGAVMDVTEPEPLPPTSRLWDFPNVVITPHVAGQSARRIDNMTDLFCRNLRRWREGRPLINYLSDKELGFPIRDGSCPLWIDVAGRADE